MPIIPPKWVFSGLEVLLDGALVYTLSTELIGVDVGS